ncbi:MAG TPA: MFS transporter [Verrucomicrobiae bacterium]|nr:MFS transporter [Verrucomicrobiae bacterium]
MTHRQLKVGYFTLAAMNTLAASYYLNYLFFFLRDRFGFGNRENLWVTALHGFIYIFAAVQCGKFAERRGYLLSLKTGFLSLLAVMVAAAFLDNVIGQLLVICVYSIVLLFTWPALESLASEKESQAGVQQMVGIYNCTWAGAAAIAYFTGGKLYDAFGKGAIFWLPAALFAAQFVLALWLERRHDAVLAATPEPVKETHHTPEAVAFRQAVSPQAFLKMAWLASPFSYIAINTLIAVMPGIAQKLELSPTRVGLFCSVWFFGRFAAFALLWKWKGWHYRFRWLVGSFVLLIASFAAILLAQKLWIVVAAQLAFGLGTGVIYYSSLFYSMDVGEGSSEHGGWHEAFIGAGICFGPATGALALQLSPGNPNAGTWAVCGLLVLGLLALIWLRVRKV